MARQDGRAEDQVAAFACTMLGAALTDQGRLAKAEPWLDRAGQTLRAELFPAAGLNAQYARGLLRWPAAGPPTSWPRCRPRLALVLVGERRARPGDMI